MGLIAAETLSINCAVRDSKISQIRYDDWEGYKNIMYLPLLRLTPGHKYSKPRRLKIIFYI